MAAPRIALVVAGDPVVLRLRLLHSGAGIVNGRLLRPQRGLLGRQIGFQLVQPCAVAVSSMRNSSSPFFINTLVYWSPPPPRLIPGTIGMETTIFCARIV
jgi:hypothetical protein